MQPLKYNKEKVRHQSAVYHGGLKNMNDLPEIFFRANFQSLAMTIT
jgi:hypothetical protein